MYICITTAKRAKLQNCKTAKLQNRGCTYRSATRPWTGYPRNGHTAPRVSPHTTHCPPTQPPKPPLRSTTPSSPFSLSFSLSLTLTLTLTALQPTPNLFETLPERSTLCHSPIHKFIIPTSVIIPLTAN